MALLTARLPALSRFSVGMADLAETAPEQLEFSQFQNGSHWPPFQYARYALARRGARLPSTANRPDE